MSERIDDRQAARYSKTCCIDGNDQRCPCDLEEPVESGVRKHSAASEGDQDRRKSVKRLAHPSNRFVAQLNARWRVVDDPLQWILQKSKGNPRSKNSGWTGRSFCTTRDALFRCVRESCGEVEPTALAQLTALPAYHGIQNLDVRGTDQAQPEGQPKPLVSRSLEVSNADE